MNQKTIKYLVVTAICLLGLFSVGLGEAVADTPQPGVAPASATGVPAEGATAEPETTTGAEAEGEATEGEKGEGETGDSEGPGLPEGVVVTRTPMPTATPGFLAEGVYQIAEETGLAGESFLGIAVEDWIVLVISLLLVLAGYLVGTWLIRRLLPRAVKRTDTELDDRLLDLAGDEVRWLVVVATLHFATIRLAFLGAGLKTFLFDIYFIAALILAMRIVWKLINLGEQEAQARSVAAEREEVLAPLITLSVRMVRVLVAVVAIAILLSHFGVDVLVLAAALGIGGLALSLAAKDTIADAIAGFIVLIDQPYRIGDRIEIKGLGTWGDVVDIGLRTTSIQTRDNRMVIVPNSTLGKDEIINYSYPDPRYRIQTHVGVAYGTDNDFAEKVIEDAVRQVERVLPDRPVDVIYNEMGDYAMIYRVRWWIENYSQRRWSYHKVHRALQKALDDAGIDSPFPTQSLNLQVEPGTVVDRSPTVGED